MAISLTQSLFSAASNGVIPGSVGEFYIAAGAINLAVNATTITGATTRAGLQTFIFPANSVIEFQGGRISSNVPVILDLNGSQIDAPAYWIFNRNVYIINCGNEQIRAEWFNDPSIHPQPNPDRTTGAQNHINKALVCAGRRLIWDTDYYKRPSHICSEVVLENRDYYVDGSIEIAKEYYFPSSNFEFTKASAGTKQLYMNFLGTDTQKLSAPGSIILDAKSPLLSSLMIPIIRVTTPAVDLKINRLSGPNLNETSWVPGSNIDGSYKYKYFGYGLLINGRIEYSSYQINYLEQLNKGIFISAAGAGYTAATNLYVQYSKFSFQKIEADYGIYIDIFDKVDAKPVFGSWFNENTIEGGRLIGGNGIYFEDHYRNAAGKVATVNLQATGQLLKINGNTFSKIGFESLDGVPMYLRGICASEFRSLRMAEDLPGIHKDKNGQFINFNSDATWVDMKYVSTVTMEIEGSIIPNHIKAQDSKFVIIKTWLTDMDDADRSHFDRLAFLPISEAGQYEYTTYGVASSSIQPYNMEKTVYSNAFEIPENTNLHIIPLHAVLPLNDTLYQPESTDVPKKSTCLVLPRKLTIVAKTGSPCRINLSGLHLFANFLFDIRLVVEQNSWAIIEYYFYNPDKNSKGCGIVVPNYANNTFSLVRQMEFYNSGEYAISFDDKWNLIINKL